MNYGGSINEKSVTNEVIEPTCNLSLLAYEVQRHNGSRKAAITQLLEYAVKNFFAVIARVADNLRADPINRQTPDSCREGPSPMVNWGRA